MLAVKRKEGEDVVLRHRETGEFIARVRVGDVSGHTVKVLIDAPQNVQVLRAELEEGSK